MFLSARVTGVLHAGELVYPQFKVELEKRRDADFPLQLRLERTRR